MRRVADELGIKRRRCTSTLLPRGNWSLHCSTTGWSRSARRLTPRSRVGDDESALESLLRTYRRYSLSIPTSTGWLRQGRWPAMGWPRLEEWAGNPWFVVTGDPYLAQALWSFAHGMVILELDGRYPPGSDLDATWAAGARAFEGPAARGRVAARQREAG